MGDPSLPPCHPAAAPPLAPSASRSSSMPGAQELALGDARESSASPVRCECLSPEVVANGCEGEAAFEGAGPEGARAGAAPVRGASWQHDGGAGTLAASMQQCRLSAASPASVRGATPSPASPSCSRASPLGLHACPPPLPASCPASSPAAPPCPQPAQPRGQAAHRSLPHDQRLSPHSRRQATSPHRSRPACALQRWQVPPRSTARWGRGMHRPPHSAPFSPASYVLGAHAAARFAQMSFGSFVLPRGLRRGRPALACACVPRAPSVCDAA
nr:putative uncharacterized protein MGC34800 [Penaeus vannamei]